MDWLAIPVRDVGIGHKHSVMAEGGMKHSVMLSIFLIQIQ